MNDELHSLGNVRLRGLLLLFVVALAAGAAGGALDRLWVARSMKVSFEPRREPGAVEERRVPEDGTTRTDRSLAERQGLLGQIDIPISMRTLQLTDSQRQRIQKISARYQPAAESLVQSIRGRVADLDLRMRQEAMCVLTPKQRNDWIAWRTRERVIVEPNDLMMKLVKTNACPK